MPRSSTMRQSLLTPVQIDGNRYNSAFQYVAIKVLSDIGESPMRAMYANNNTIFNLFDDILKSRGKIIDQVIVEALADAIRKLNLNLDSGERFGGRYTEMVRRAIILSKEAV